MILTSLPLALLLPIAPPPALPTTWAFSDPSLFGEPAQHGGGGGRYFTGSSRDGFGCSVCHRGGTEPRVTVEGLPDRFVPGTRYEVTLRWDEPDVSHALQLELSDPAGRHANLDVAAPDDLPAASRCEGEADGVPAVYLVELEERRILGVQDCGASEVSFSFTAPDEPELQFSAGIVRSDSSATADGDGVLELRWTIPQEGQDSGEGCSVGSRGAAPSWSVLVVIAVLVARRKNTPQRNSAPNNAVISRACTRSKPTKAR